MGPAAASPLGAEASVVEGGADRPAPSVGPAAAGDAPTALVLGATATLGGDGALEDAGSLTVGAAGAGGGGAAGVEGAGCVKGSLGSGRRESKRGAGLDTGFLIGGSGGGASDVAVTSSAMSTGGRKKSAR